MSAGSTPSGASGASSKTENSAPPGVQLGELRECRSVSVLWDTPVDGVYEFKEKCGEGGFGEVWHCTHKVTAFPYAIKRLAAREKTDVERLVKELKAFERFNCAYIVRLHEVFLDHDFVYMVMDLCTGGDLAKFSRTFQDEPERILKKMDFPDQVKGLPTTMVGQLLWQMLVGIAYMHHHRFCHRDIKMENYVIQEPAKLPVLQLVDFGMTVRYSRGSLMTATLGTVKYMAPEVLNAAYNEKCDIWSIGVLAFILCTERSPWGANKASREVCRCISENQREPWPPCDKPKVLRNLVETMLTRDYNTRPGAKDILKVSGWLKQFAPPDLEPGRSPSSRACCSVS